MKFVVVIAAFFSFQALSLSPKIEALLENQAPVFHDILARQTRPQRMLVLERYADLLMSSPYTLHMRIDFEEVRRTLFDRFLNAEGNEALSPKQERRIHSSVHSNVIYAELQRVSEALSGQLRPGLLDLQFSCQRSVFTFPLSVAELQSSYFLTLDGVPVPLEDGRTAAAANCLAIRMEVGDPTAHLTWLSTKEAACPLPSENAAQCLMSLAEQIARAAGKRSIQLYDGSTIRCPVNRAEASLRRLKMYQEGRTWYQKFGYVAVRKDKHAAKMTKLNTYKLRTLLDVLPQMTGEELSTDQSTKLLIYEEAEEFFDSGFAKTSTVSQFMTWLWIKDCTRYITIDRFITDPSRRLEFSRNFPSDLQFVKDLAEQKAPST